MSGSRVAGNHWHSLASSPASVSVCVGRTTEAKATVRFIFCVHNENEEEGALDLLNLMELVERALLENPFFNNYGYPFYLDREAGLEDLIYTDDTRPFYAGEIAATFVLPATERNVTQWLRS